MSEVILVYIHHKQGSIRLTPPGIHYIGTYLKNNGFSVRLFNLIVDDDKKIEPKDLKELTKDLANCLCVGFSVMTPQVPKSLHLTKIIKELKPDIKIVWGGAHPTLFSEQVIENEYIDFVITREGEQPMLELIRMLKTKKHNFEDINGLVFKKDNKIVSNPPQGLFKDFEKIMPDWGLVDEFARTTMESYNFGELDKVIWVHTGRGCPYRCTFCINNTFFGKTRRIRPIDSIIEEIRQVIKRFQPTMIFLSDENFFINRGKVEEFSRKLKEAKINIKWSACSRVNYFDNYDDNFLQMIKKSGCKVISFGAESGSQKCLDYLKKDIKPEQTYNAAVKCVRNGIFPLFSFMIGLPPEKKEDILHTFDLIRKIKKLSDRVGFATMQILRPYPGGEIYQDCLNYGFDEPKKLEGWDQKNDTYFSLHLNAKYLKWIKDPEYIEVIAKYGSKSFNNYLCALDINPLLKVMIHTRTYLFDKLVYNYIKTDNKIVRQILKVSMVCIDYISGAGKTSLQKTSNKFKSI